MSAPTPSRRLRYILPLLVIAGLAGCSAGDGSSSTSGDPAGEDRTVGSWVASYMAMLESDPGIALSSFEASVLEDSFVTDEEYREAQDRFRSCMEDRGWEVAFLGGHSAEVVGALDNPRAFEEGGSRDDFESCEQGTLFHIQPIFLAQNYNPEGLGPVELMRACFSRTGSDLAAEMTDEELLEFEFSVARGERRVDPVDALCLIDPTGQLGLDEQTVGDRLGWG